MDFKNEHSNMTASKTLGDETLKQVSGGGDGSAYQEGDFVTFRVLVINPPYGTAGILPRYETKQGVITGCSNGQYTIVTEDGGYSVLPQDILGKL